MANNFIQTGTAMSYINNTDADIESGDIVPFASGISIAKTHIPIGEVGTLGTVGVYALPKSTAAFSQGQNAFYKEGQVIASEAEGAIAAGVVWADAIGSDDQVAVKIG